MPKILFVEHDGTPHAVETEAGKSLMQSAVDNLVPGIVGDCGGGCSCATCHGYVDAPWRDRLPPPGPDEAMMLEGVPERRPGSRLTCQIRASAALDGIVVRLPRSQY